MVDYDVVQIGFGPVGQAHAALLGARGHSVAVFDKWPELYPLPRAGHVDHEIMRILQSAGATSAFGLAAIPIPDYDWVNAEGKLLLHMDWNQPTPSGWKSDYLMYQPDLEDALRTAAEKHPGVTVEPGWEAHEIVEHDDHVEVRLRRVSRGDTGLAATGAERTVTARYVVGADGANSFVRAAAGIDWEDLGFQEDWLVVDVQPNDPDVVIDMPDAGQICDPARPVSLFRWLGRRTMRWEFMLHQSESADAMLTDENIWSLLARWDVRPDNAKVIRKKVYTFRSLIASTFRRDRIILIGDSAHLMPPFMGQGMCSGIRDAANIAWKLDLVLRGAASDDLLDTYTVERRPHAKQLVETSIALGQIVCMSDPEAVAARDAAFFAGETPPPPPFPWILEGMLEGGESTDVVGHLGLQARLVRKERVGLADDVLGHGWTILSKHGGYLDDLDAGQRAVLEALDVKHAHVSQATLDSADSAVDVDADYSRWFVQIGAPIAVIRPDFYVFGLAQDSADLGRLLDDLSARAGLSV